MLRQRVKTAPAPFFVKPIARRIAAKVMDSFVTPNLQRQLDFMKAELTRSPWFAGDAFSAADVQMSLPIEAAAQRAGLDARRPRLMDLPKRIDAWSACRRALERGGPYRFGR
jgi:glutathione S-transferase